MARQNHPSRRDEERASIQRSLIINLAYAVFKGWAGLQYRSVWFGALALYYILAALARSSLARSLRRQESPKKGWERYSQTGWLLWLLSLVLSVLGTMMIFHQDRIAYPGYLIYAVAAYTFYAVISAVSSLIRHRRLAQPVPLAGKTVSLCTALVSLFSMQTAMLAQFGSDEGFSRVMSCLTGSGVFILVHGIAIYMILHGRKQKKAAQA